MDMCDVCKKRESRHLSWNRTQGNKALCCKCHVAEGNAPADWHKECLSAYEQINTKQGE